MLKQSSSRMRIFSNEKEKKTIKEWRNFLANWKNLLFVKITSEKDREEIACGVQAEAILKLEEAAGLDEAWELKGTEIEWDRADDFQRGEISLFRKL